METTDYQYNKQSKLNQLRKAIPAEKLNTDLLKNSRETMPCSSRKSLELNDCNDCKLYNMRLNDFTEVVRDLSKELQLCKDIIESFITTKFELSAVNDNKVCQKSNHAEKPKIPKPKQKNFQTQKTIPKLTSPLKNRPNVNYKNILMQKLVGNSVPDVFTKSADY